MVPGADDTLCRLMCGMGCAALHVHKKMPLRYPHHNSAFQAQVLQALWWHSSCCLFHLLPGYRFHKQVTTETFPHSMTLVWYKKKTIPEIYYKNLVFKFGFS